MTEANTSSTTSPDLPRIIAMINQKGGVGKTTTTANLAAALALAGRHVLVVDLDPQAHLTLHLGVDPDELEHSIYDLMVDDDLGALDIACRIENHDSEGGSLALLPANVNLAGIEAELGPKMVTGQAQQILKQKCDPMIFPEGYDAPTPFDYVLLDCPPSLGLLTINGLTLSREVIVPMQAHFLALQGLSKLFETVRLIRQSFNPQLSVAGVVLCMHEKQTVLATEVVADLKTFLDANRNMDVPWRHARVYSPPVRRNIKLAEGPSFGQTIFQYAPSSNGAEDYRRLAEDVDAGVAVEQSVMEPQEQDLSEDAAPVPPEDLVGDDQPLQEVTLREESPVQEEIDPTSL